MLFWFKWSCEDGGIGRHAGLRDLSLLYSGEGSNPFPRTILKSGVKNLTCASASSIISTLLRKWLSGRASPCQGEGREFESRLPLHCADVVQW